MHIFDIPEVLVRIFPFLSTVERAHGRLITPTFNEIYQIEERRDLINIWKGYCQELVYEYPTQTLNDEQLIKLTDQFGMNNTIQYHLKIWLTNCATGRYDFNDLISIGPVEDWEFVVETPLINIWPDLYLIFDSWFGRNEWKQNIISIDKSERFLDKRDGVFYLLQGTSYRSLKRLGNIKDWIESIPIHTIRPLSLGIVDSYLEILDNGREYEQIMREGSKEKLLEFLKRAQYYEFLCDELKRDSDILNEIKGDSLLYSSAFIPVDIRKDRDRYFDLFTFFDSHSYLHHSLRKDKEFTVKLLKQYPEFIDIRKIDTTFINDPDVSQYFGFDTRLSSIGFKVKTREEIHKFIEYGLDIHMISPELVNDLPFMVKVINEHLGTHFKDEYLEDKNGIIDHLYNRKYYILTIVSPKLRNDKEFMMKCININAKCSVLIGDSLKNDSDVLANDYALKYVSGLNLTKSKIIETLKKMEEDDIDYIMEYSSINNFMPPEYLQDEQFVLDLIEISAYAHVLMQKNQRKSLEFWKKAIKLNANLLDFGIPSEILDDYSIEIDRTNLPISHFTKKMLDDQDFISKIDTYKLSDSYRFASERVRSNKELLLTCMEFDSATFMYAPPALKSDKEVLQALKECGYLISLPSKLPSRFGTNKIE